MKVGTKSVLFGVHAFWLHPWIVAVSWFKLYGFPVDPRLWIAFIVHDWGYWGCADMDGPEGKFHPLLGGKIMSRLFGVEWEDFVKYHSRGLARIDSKPPSKLCLADKLAWTIEPWWLYLPRARLSGELTLYMKDAIGHFEFNSPKEWYYCLQAYARKIVADLQNNGVGLWCSSVD